MKPPWEQHCFFQAKLLPTFCENEAIQILRPSVTKTNFWTLSAETLTFPASPSSVCKDNRSLLWCPLYVKLPRVFIRPSSNVHTTFERKNLAHFASCESCWNFTFMIGLNENVALGGFTEKSFCAILLHCSLGDRTKNQQFFFCFSVFVFSEKYSWQWKPQLPGCCAFHKIPTDPSSHADWSTKMPLLILTSANNFRSYSCISMWNDTRTRRNPRCLAFRSLFCPLASRQPNLTYLAKKVSRSDKRACATTEDGTGEPGWTAKPQCRPCFTCSFLLFLRDSEIRAQKKKSEN